MRYEDNFKDCIVAYTRIGDGKLYPIYSKALLRAKMEKLTGSEEITYAFRFMVE